MALRKRPVRVEVPVIETKRLVLRPLEPVDLEELCVLQAEESFWLYPFRRGFSRQETERFLDFCLGTYRAGEIGIHAVVEKGSGALAGHAGLSVPHWLKEVLPAVEVGWRLGSAFRGKGYATESAAAALSWGFGELGLESVLAMFDPDNVASGRVMDHLGFETLRETRHPEFGHRIEIRTLRATCFEQLVEAQEWPR